MKLNTYTIEEASPPTVGAIGSEAIVVWHGLSTRAECGRLKSDGMFYPDRFPESPFSWTWVKRWALLREVG